MITELSKCFLIAAARRCLQSVLTERKTITFDQHDMLPQELNCMIGAYVSLLRWPEGDLRASHGHAHPDVPLGELVLKSSIGCVAHETVFPKVTAEELDKVTIRIHVLGESSEVKIPSKADLDGRALYLRYWKHSAIFLPEVIVLAGWDLLEAASQLCLKAGLPGDMWVMKDAEFRTFKVCSFGESEPGASMATTLLVDR